VGTPLPDRKVNPNTENEILMKPVFYMLIVITIVFTACTRNPFDRIEPTDVEQYSIVYDDGKCGMYDNHADSLITTLKYDALRYNRTTIEDGLEISIWRCELDSCIGMLAIEHSTNETMEIIFPKK
jgi:hypothetical protein